MWYTLELHLVASARGYLFEGFQGGVSNRNAAFAAGSLLTIQFALGDASCRQRTFTPNESPSREHRNHTLFSLRRQTNSVVFGDRTSTPFSLPYSVFLLPFPTEVMREMFLHAPSRPSNGGSALIGIHSQNKGAAWTLPISAIC